jgi:Holliday junction resolvase-like predicted endonuclease
MEVSYTVVGCRKEDDRRFTEKAFLGRLCETVVGHYLKKEKKWEVLGTNQSYKFTEVDILAYCPKTKVNWIVEVRGRRGNSHPPVLWLSPQKVKKLKLVSNLLSEKHAIAHRILFVQTLVLSIQKGSDEMQKKYRYQVKAELNEFEVDASS